MGQWGDENVNRKRKVRESVNVKKSEYNLIYLNLNKILYIWLKKRKYK